MTETISTYTLERPDATIAYDVREPAQPASSPALLLVGQPMTADGFAALAEELGDRRVVTYDPRGLGRSTRSDGRTDHDPHQQAADLHALIEQLGGEPVDMFASSGGAVTALALVSTYPDDVRVLVAHEPPIFDVLPDAEFARAASARGDRAYQEHGFGAGMAAFIQFASHTGEFTQEDLDQPLAQPGDYGLPPEDDGSRDDPVLSDASKPITAYVPDFEALQAAGTRIIAAAGEQSHQAMPGRAAVALAARLGCEPVFFRGGHGGFMADEWGTPGDPAAFATQLRAAL